MNVTINDCALNVEVMGPEDGPVLIAHHGGGGIGSLAEPKATFGPLADRFRVVVFDARGCGHSQGVPPYSHAQWAADVDGLRQWIGADKIVVAGGSYGGFIALEYAVAYPEHVQAIVLRDTSADATNLKLAYENARNQDRVEINWDNFDRYWSGRIRDDEDLKARWAEIIPLYDYEYDPVRSAAAVESGIYRHESHNWCFQYNTPSYDLKPQLPAVTGAHAGHRRPPRLGHPGQRRPDHRRPDAEREAGRLREVRPLAADRGARAVPVHRPRLPRRGRLMNITIIGSGAIGGTLGAHMIRAGHDITLCDADATTSPPSASRGLIIEGPVNEFTVAAHAITPDELPDQITHAIVAVKSLHTRAAAELLRSRLAPDGYVLTVQNGLTADHLIAAVGRDRVVSSFVNVGADVMAPGRILQGNVATFRVGELDGGRITPRVLALADALPYAEPTDNVLGYLWGKEAYGAMLWAGAVSDLTIAEHLEDPRYRPVMIAIAREVLAQAPVPVESFDGFEPDDLEGSLDRLAAFNRNSAKKYSGIYRDLVVRKRKTEIDEMLRDINGPIFNKVAEIIHDIEDGRRVNTRANLDELADFVAELPAA